MLDRSRELVRGEEEPPVSAQRDHRLTRTADFRAERRREREAERPLIPRRDHLARRVNGESSRRNIGHLSVVGDEHGVFGSGLANCAQEAHLRSKAFLKLGRDLGFDLGDRLRSGRRLRTFCAEPSGERRERHASVREDRNIGRRASAKLRRIEIDPHDALPRP